MRRWLIALAVTAGAATPGLVCAQTPAPTPQTLPEGRLRLGYTTWDTTSDEARRWDRPAFTFTQDAERWGETKDTARSARIGYGLSDRTELFVGVTKARGPDTFDSRRDWKEIEDRKRKAYSIGLTKRW